MGEANSTKPEVANVEAAIKKLAAYDLHSSVRKVDGDEPHRVLPAIWPVIQELCIIADASKAGMLVVKE